MYCMQSEPQGAEADAVRGTKAWSGVHTAWGIPLDRSCMLASVQLILDWPWGQYLEPVWHAVHAPDLPSVSHVVPSPDL